MKELQSAVRQYQHNDCSGLVMGYDRAETERVVSELLRERNELAAQVERLRGVLEGVTKVEHKRGGSLGSDGQFYYRVGERQFSKIESALSETPAQSLDAVKREWLVESFSKIEANMNDIAAEANEESNVMLQSSALFAAEVMRRHSVRLKP